MCKNFSGAAKLIQTTASLQLWQNGNLQRKTEALGEKPVPVPLRPQTPHHVRTDRTQPSAVCSQQPTAGATARPHRYVAAVDTPQTVGAFT